MSIMRLHHITLHPFRSATAVLLLGIILSLTATPGIAKALSLVSVRQCDSAAIISCGALSTEEIASRYDASSYVQKVYSYFGITKDDIQQLGVTAQAGRVDKNGNVYLHGNSTPVATKAISAEARNSSGATSITSKGATFYKQPLGSIVQSSSQTAFTVMNSGTFRFAIISSNGNPVIVPAKPKPVVLEPATVEPPTPAISTQDTLPNTGASWGSIMVIFVLTSFIGTFASRRYQLRQWPKRRTLSQEI